MQALGLQVAMPELQPDAFPFWDSCMMVLSIVAMILMTRKYVENWLLWVIINVISVVIFALQGVYAMSLEYIILTFIALNGSRMWIKAHAKEVHVRCPINDDDVNGQTPFIQVAVWPMTRLIFHLNGGVLNLIVIHQVVLDPIQQGIVIVWRDHLHAASSPASRLPSIHAHGAHCGLPDFPAHTTLQFGDIQRYRCTFK